MILQDIIWLALAFLIIIIILGPLKIEKGKFFEVRFTIAMDKKINGKEGLHFSRSIHIKYDAFPRDITSKMIQAALNFKSEYKLGSTFVVYFESHSSWCKSFLWTLIVRDIATDFFPP